MFYKLLHLGQWAYENKVPKLPGIVSKLVRRLYACDIPSDLKLPKSVKFAHNGLGCCINSGVIFGENVYVHQHVTIGKRKENEGSPIIGNNVLIGAGAIIIGNIKIGDNAKIGAGAVVVDDVPNNSTYVASKGIIINKDK